MEFNSMKVLSKSENHMKTNLSSTVNHPLVHAPKCVNGREPTYHSRKTLSNKFVIVQNLYVNYNKKYLKSISYALFKYH